MKHVHRWVRAHTRGILKDNTFVGEKCRCGERRERQATFAEWRKIATDWNNGQRQSKLMHAVWRKVQKVWEVYKEARTQDLKWKFMQKMHRLAERYPDHIRCAAVDDDCHASSDLWFISHKFEHPKLGKGYWGTSVIYIGQCSSDAPVGFFLYPDSHALNVMGVLKQLDVEARRLNGRGRNMFP